MEVLRKAFSQQLDPAVSKFVGCVDDDKFIVDADIHGSIAHARMLAHTHIISEAQADNIVDGLQQLQAAYAEGQLQLKPQWEDVHMNVEGVLRHMVGEDALRLHTARSRNDQVALDMRIYVCEEIAQICRLLQRAQLEFIQLAEDNLDIVMPGYTHLQRAQPVLFAHALHAFVEMLTRDVERFSDAKKRAMVSPLGAGALAGTSLPISPEYTAKLLGFERAFANSIDAVCDRDSVLDFLSAATACALHLSQIAETLILWAGAEFSFVSLNDSVTTASSLMPNKKNPDPLEIIRAKCGGITGDLISVIMTLKSLPLGYNRDLQETKPPMLRAAASLKQSLLVLAHVVAAVHPNKSAMEVAAGDSMMLATDLVEYLIRCGVPMRQAHDVISEIVADCRAKQLSLADLSPAQFREYSPVFGAEVVDLLSASKSAAAKTSPGGTASSQVKLALQKARERLA